LRQEADDMNAKQRRAQERAINRDHFRWPLGTAVTVLGGHHSPAAVGMTGKVGKHGYPCKDGFNCIVDFPEPVVDTTFGHVARFGHYIKYKHLRKNK
jgi:hypothetical protein